MKNNNLEEWIQGIGLLGIIGSLIFVGMELRQSENTAYMELFDNATERNAELSSMIVENSDLWHRACLGEELTEPESIVAAQIYRGFLQLNWNNWLRYQETGMGSFDSGFLTDAFAANFHRYPGFRTLAQSYQDWRELGIPLDAPVVEEYREALATRVAQLQELEPEPNADVKWCGVM